MEITKEFFNKYLSVTISAELQVFDKIKPSIDNSLEAAKQNILGAAGTAAVEASPDTPLANFVKGFACTDALVTQLRQLDLVLTPTGFGIVSNNTTSPASRERVDALEKSLLLARECAYGMILVGLRSVEGWAASEQAVKNISSPFYSIYFVSSFPTQKDYETWLKMKTIIPDADLEIREMIGCFQMDDIMEKVRQGTTDVVYCDMANLICEFYRMQYWHSPCCDDKKRYILQFVEDNLETFSIYKDSKEYLANHHEGYKNSREKRIFFFGS